MTSAGRAAACCNCNVAWPLADEVNQNWGFGIRAMSRSLEPVGDALERRHHIGAYDSRVRAYIMLYDEVDGKHVREFHYEACTSMGRMFSSIFACRCTAQTILAHFTSHK